MGRRNTLDGPERMDQAARVNNAQVSLTGGKAYRAEWRRRKLT
jgi:hypothetical protein